MNKTVENTEQALKAAREQLRICAQSHPHVNGARAEVYAAIREIDAALHPAEQPDHVNGAVEMVQPEAAQDERPTGDQLRAIARNAENMSGPSDSTRPVDYVFAGWQAAKRDALTAPQRAEMTDEEILDLAAKYKLPVITKAGYFPWAYIDPLKDFARALLSQSKKG